MFTGIIDHCGVIVKMEDFLQSKRVWVKTSFKHLELGESIAVDGICVTVTECKEPIFCCDISPETLRVTSCKHFALDQLINLERPLLPTSRLGGHWVMGHVDKICTVKTIRKINEFVEMTFYGLSASSRRYLVKKGSIAVNGVSLTINEVYGDGFSVMLIPHTLECTNFLKLRESDVVNIEFDMTAKIIVDQCEQYFAALQIT